MKTHAVICLMSLLSIWICTGQGQNVKPEVTPKDFLAKITTNSVILKQPHCFFDSTVAPCNSVDCEIWLVSALESANNTFDADATNPGILSLSPYPTAFNAQNSKNYSLTKVGLLKDFPCGNASNDLYFIVGKDGNCSSTNCNGVLPDGSKVRFKYVLVNPTSKLIVNQTAWSDVISLYNATKPQTIDDGLKARSGAMIVITTILSVAMALLLLFFLIIICLQCCGKRASKPITVINSLRIPQYDTHHLKDLKRPYDNPAYETEGKSYSTSDTLPRSGGAP